MGFTEWLIEQDKDRLTKQQESIDRARYIVGQLRTTVSDCLESLQNNGVCPTERRRYLFHVDCKPALFSIFRSYSLIPEILTHGESYGWFDSSNEGIWSRGEIRFGSNAEYLPYDTPGFADIDAAWLSTECNLPKCHTVSSDYLITWDEITASIARNGKISQLGDVEIVRFSNKMKVPPSHGFTWRQAPFEVVGGELEDPGKARSAIEMRSSSSYDACWRFFRDFIYEEAQSVLVGRN